MYKMAFLNSVNIHLHKALWVWLTAVFTNDDPPLARSQVFLEIYPSHFHVTVFVCTEGKLE